MIRQSIPTLIDEIDAMVQFAAGTGIAVPPEVVVQLYQVQQKQPLSDAGETDNSYTEQDLTDLSLHHAAMAELVAPAQPKSIRIMQDESDNRGWLFFLGPVALMRRLSLSAVCFLLMIIGTSVSPLVNRVSINEGLFDSAGLTLLLNQLFLLSCAGLGATFAALNQLNQFIKQGTYEPKFDSSYWARIIMGLMSGLIISELLPLNTLDLQKATGIEDFDKPLAALLGGFAADMLYRILSRMVELVNQLFGGQTTK